MKKLTVVASFILASLTGFSGAAMWGATNIKASPDAPYVYGVTAYSAYLYIISGSVSYDSVIQSWSSGNYAAATSVAAASRTSTTGGEPSAPTMTFLNSAYGNYDAGDTVSAFMIIADGTTENNTENYLVALYSTQGHSNPIETITFESLGNKTLGWGSQAANTAWKEIGAVPEPFSGALALIGFAGIGLKRKFRKQKKA